jgi:glycosyltransferase involved in cell wall biosynthesis
VKPVLFVTGYAPAYRVGAFERLHARELIELALFGGRHTHAGEAATERLAAPHRHVRPRELTGLAASGAYRAVVIPTGGRAAPLAGWAGARRARVPVILWASLWAHPRTAAHAISYLPLRRLYRSADAVVTYGPHVSAYVRARGARNVHVAPQSVDNDFWSAPVPAPAPAGLPDWSAQAKLRFLFVGRPAREKGLEVLLRAWAQAELAPRGVLLLAGVGAELPLPRGRLPPRLRGGAADVICLEPVDAAALRSLYAACDALVLPSIPTRTFREPWGLVVNEAMNRGLPVICSDAVGAAAGGLVRDGANGLVVRAGDSAALAHALRRLADDGALRARLGGAGEIDVRAFSHQAWAEGFSAALRSVGVARERW